MLGLAVACLLAGEAWCQTDAVARSIEETEYWMPKAAELGNASTLFRNDLQDEIDGFRKTKDRYGPLVKRWAAIYLKKIKESGPRTLYVGPITPGVYPICIYDYEGRAFWQVGNIRAIEDPYEISPTLVTRILTFDFLLGGTCDADARAEQMFLIKWQVANCVLDGLRVDISAEDVENADLVP